MSSQHDILQIHHHQRVKKGELREKGKKGKKGKKEKRKRKEREKKEKRQRKDREKKEKRKRKESKVATKVLSAIKKDSEFKKRLFKIERRQYNLINNS